MTRTLGRSPKRRARHVRPAMAVSVAALCVFAMTGLTGCRVEAFIGGNHISPDLAAELFVLDRPIVARVESPPD